MTRVRIQSKSAFFRTAAGAALSVILAVGLVGCGKQRTQLSLSRAKDLRTKSVEYLAQEYHPEELKQLEDMINRTENQMNAKNYAESVPLSKQAVTRGRDLVEKSRLKHSTTLRDRALKDMEVARANDGKAQNAEMYAEIEGIIDQITQSYTDSEHDNVIELAQRMRQKLNELLAPLKLQSEEGRADVKNKIEEMKREQVPQYAREYMTEVEGYLQQIDTLINDERNYKKAIELSRHAMMTAAQGITKALEKRSMEKIQEVEHGLTQAQSLGAGKEFQRDLYAQCSETFSVMLEKHYNKEYTIVLNSIDVLRARVEQLIVETKKEAARAAINSLQIGLIALVDGDAKEFPTLKGSVEEIEQLLAQAQRQFDAGEQDPDNYDEVQKTCAAGAAKVNETKQRFDRLAADHIREAQNSRQEANKVFDRATELGFFIMKDESKVQEIDAPFERSKQTLFEQIKASLASVQAQIELAQTRRSEEKYKNAIDISKASKASAEANLREVHHVAAHNATVELADRIRHFVQDGAEEYAAEEINQARTELAQVRQMLSQNKYREALDKAAETRSSVENAVSALDKKAKDEIAAAKERYEKAVEEGVLERKPGKMNLAGELIKDSSENIGVAPPDPLEADRIIYNRSIKQAVEAQSLVSAAREEKAREDAVEAITLAARVLEQAEESMAERFAGATLDDARARLQQARVLQDEGKFVEAALVAEQARLFARDGLYHLVSAADDAIVTARVYRGWDLRRDTLADAIIMNRQARQKMGEGKYAEAHALARAAANKAKSVTEVSRDRDFRHRVKTLYKMLQEATKTGSSFFKVEELKTIMADLRRLHEDYETDEYDRFSTRLASVQGRLEELIQSTPGAMDELVEERMRYLDELERLGAKEIARYELELSRRALNQARQDFLAKRYQKSYEMLLRGITLANGIAREIHRENFREDARAILDDLADALYGFRQFLRYEPGTLVQFVTGVNARGRILSMAGADNPAQFADRTRALYSRALDLEPPAALSNLHTELVAACRDAMMAGKTFEKFLILDQFGVKQRQDIIESGYRYIDRVRARHEWLRARLLGPNERLPDRYQAPIEKMLYQ